MRRHALDSPTINESGAREARRWRVAGAAEAQLRLRAAAGGWPVSRAGCSVHRSLRADGEHRAGRRAADTGGLGRDAARRVLPPFVHRQSAPPRAEIGSCDAAARAWRVCRRSRRALFRPAVVLGGGAARAHLGRFALLDQDAACAGDPPRERAGDHLDRAMSYSVLERSSNGVAPYLPECVELADALGFQGLAADLRELVADELAPPVPAEVARTEPRGFQLRHQRWRSNISSASGIEPRSGCVAEAPAPGGGADSGD